MSKSIDHGIPSMHTILVLNEDMFETIIIIIKKYIYYLSQPNSEVENVTIKKNTVETSTKYKIVQ